MTSEIASVLAFDLGGTNNKMWFDNGETVASEKSLAEADEDTILKSLQHWIGNNKQIRVVGIALPCTMLPEKGGRKILSTSTKFASLARGKHQGIIRKMEKAWEGELGRKVSILNDGEAASIDVFAHLQNHYPNKNYKNVMVMTLGTSIGVGFIFNSNPYVGPYPSRSSHIIIDPMGDWCMKENHRGCWKTLAGDKARRDLALNMGFEDPENKTLGMDTKLIADKARSGLKKAQLYFKVYAERVARGIATIISAVPVECVVIAGGVARAGQVLLDPLKERLERGDLLDPDLAPLIDLIQVDTFSVAHGAQIYAFHQHA